MDAIVITYKDDREILGTDYSHIIRNLKTKKGIIKNALRWVENQRKTWKTIKPVPTYMHIFTYTNIYRKSTYTMIYSNDIE